MIKRIEFPFSSIPQLSERDIAYQNEEERLTPFYKYKVELDEFENVIENRKKHKVDRQLLHQVMMDQYKDLPNSEKAKSNINKILEENCFTVITAHQPSLLTGPLYYIIKICSAIRLAKDLNEAYSGFSILPVFIMGGEDHDFDEIATLHFFGKSFTWSSDQKGAVGRMNLEGLDDIIKEIKNTFGTTEYAKELIHKIDNAFLEANSYGDFMQRFTHNLFHNYGLLTINMDNKKLKSAFLPYAIKEIKESVSHRLVNKDQEQIESVGLKRQAHAREINLFYHEDGRNRIIKIASNQFEIAGIVYSEEEIIDLISANPESISPNVVLRPVYQELIFPNLAYIGGGGELAYWMERVSLFEALSLPFPMLIRRDSLLIADSKVENTLKSFNLDISDLFEREEQVIIKYTKEDSDSNLSLSEEKESLNKLFEAIKNKAQSIDSTLLNSVNAELSKSIKSVENLENKMLKAEKRKKETQINKIIKIKSKLFPNNDSLQERYENFIPFYLKFGDKWIKDIIDNVDPLNKNFKVLIIEN